MTGGLYLVILLIPKVACGCKPGVGVGIFDWSNLDGTLGGFRLQRLPVPIPIAIFYVGDMSAPSKDMNGLVKEGLSYVPPIREL